MSLHCPHCGEEISIPSPAAMLGSKGGSVKSGVYYNQSGEDDCEVVINDAIVLEVVDINR